MNNTDLHSVIRREWTAALIATGVWVVTGVVLSVRALTNYWGWGFLACLAIWFAACAFRRGRDDRSRKLAALYIYELQQEFKLPEVRAGCEDDVRGEYFQMLMKDHPELRECTARAIADQEDMERLLGKKGKEIKELHPEFFEREDDE